MKLATILVTLCLAGCAAYTLPQGQEHVRSFTQESSVPYQDAYRLVAKQMRACYRVIGVFGNGYDVQADLDTAQKSASIELYSVGLAGAEKPEDSIFSRTVTIKGTESGSVITTTGQTPKYVFMNHSAIKGWLSGGTTCAP
jgi:hypothetical protein